MRSEAQARVIGGGVGGASIAYPLARLGWKDVVLVEQYDLTSGSTWHSAGLVGQLRSSVSRGRMMMYSVGLYADLRRETGKDPGWHEVGGLRLASSPERTVELRRQARWAGTSGASRSIRRRPAARGAPRARGPARRSPASRGGTGACRRWCPTRGGSAPTSASTPEGWRRR